MRYLRLHHDYYGSEHTQRARAFTPSKFSPDIAKLDQLEYHRIFICDELMSTRRSHVYISNQVIHNVVAFTADRFDYILDPDGIAVPIPDDHGYPIKGELWIVRPQCIYEMLDKLKLNRVHYIRKRVDVIDPYRTSEVDKTNYVNNGYYDTDGLLLPKSLAGRKGTEYRLSPELTWPQNAWMYLYNPDHWTYILRRQSSTFTRVPTFRPKKEKTWLSEYYYYQNPTKDHCGKATEDH